jgi:hypothetical protein
MSKYTAATDQGTYAREARACLVALVKHVFAHRDAPLAPVTYQELAARIGRLNKHGVGHGHGLGQVLGIMGHLLERIEGDWGEGIPKIQALVVNKAGPLRGLPDSGIKEFWPNYENLNRVEKERHVQTEQGRVAQFGSRWNQVLARLELPTVIIDEPTQTRGRYGSGESPNHRALQEWVRDHPELVGATREWAHDENYILPSLDQIDLLFRSPERCIAVEVKSRLSDSLPQDYERGIYQTIKYAAVLRAMHSAGAGESRADVSSVLVLESLLPPQYRQVASRLGVKVIESVRPKPSAGLAAPSLGNVRAANRDHDGRVIFTHATK